MNRAKYTEPSDFIPKDIRKEFKLGEFADETKKVEKAKKETNRNIRNFVNDKK